MVQESNMHELIIPRWKSDRNEVVFEEYCGALTMDTVRKWGAFGTTLRMLLGKENCHSPSLHRLFSTFKAQKAFNQK